jgi:hypothetical protein
VAADRPCSQRRPAEPCLLTTGDAGVPDANPRWAVLRARLRRWGAAAGVALERLGRLWEPRRDAGLPSRDSSDAADRSIGPRPHAATPDSHPDRRCFSIQDRRAISASGTDRRRSGSLLTLRWREVDSNFQYAGAVNLVSRLFCRRLVGTGRCAGAGAAVQLACHRRRFGVSLAAMLAAVLLRGSALGSSRSSTKPGSDEQGE